MGHSDINITFRTYRHLLPGSVSKAAILLNNGLDFSTTTAISAVFPDDGVEIPGRASRWPVL
ncbi:hypothetical protein [Streptomyces sp. NPDC057428]|uniref:hypothetical protein n=1 Tax=Streptomyces sp. NPDC057428 TaxID=3346129 RepID=UPI0036AF74D4